MESGFPLAGQPIAFKKQRARSVSPREKAKPQLPFPIADGVAGDQEAEQGDEDEQAEKIGDEDEAVELAKKYEQLKGKVEA